MFVTAYVPEEKVVLFVPIKGPYQIEEAEEKLVNKNGENLQLWAEPPTQKHEYFQKLYPEAVNLIEL